MTRSARLRAYAKLNLGLRILYKRTDGYHELRTVFQTISLSDRLEVSFTPGRTARIVVEGTPDIADNLVDRAARLLCESFGIHGDISVKLKKNIPSGAGLGGGSSDAAAILLALPILAGKRLSITQLLPVAAELGSDVAFFLYGGTALGSGRGEELYPLPEGGPRHGLVAAPEIHSSTADAYRELSSRLTSIALQNKLVSFQQEIWQGGKGVDANDFEGVVFARYPKLERIKQRFLDLGANAAAMTGSGSAIFGLFDDARKLDRAKKSFSDERVYPISFVSRAQYRSAWMRALAKYAKSDKWPPQSLYAR
jgi:4-diphosphocytidyl-2-C-methyl-D-erythritol kinase